MDNDNDIEENNFMNLDVSLIDEEKKEDINTTKCQIFRIIYFDYIICLLIFAYSFLSFSYVNLFNFFFSLFIQLFLDITFPGIITIKYCFVIISLIINIAFFICYTVFFALSFTTKRYLTENVNKYFLIKNDNLAFTIFNYSLYFSEVVILCIYFLVKNWKKETWLMVEYKVQLNFLSKVKKVRNHILSFGLYMICLGASFLPTSINCGFLLIVLIHFFTLIFNKKWHGYFKKYIAMIFCFIIPIFMIINYLANVPGCYDWIKGSDSLPIYGLILIYEDPSKTLSTSYFIYDIQILHVVPFILFFIGYGAINLFLKSKDLKGSNEQIKKDPIYDDDIDSAIVNFLSEAKNLSLLNKIKLFVSKYIYSPSFLLHFCRFGMIIWINTYITYISFFVIIWILISMVASDKPFFLQITKIILLPLLILSFSFTYICNIEGINIEWEHLGLEKYKTQAKIFNNMALKITIITILQAFVHVKMKYVEVYNKNLEREEENFVNINDVLIKKEIKNVAKTNYALTSIEILFKFCFFITDILLIIFLYFSVCQSINIFNEFMLLFIVSLFIFSHIIDKWYFAILIIMNLTFQFKYLIFFIYPNKTKEEYNNNIFNLFSLLFYDELKSPYYYWLANYFLYINYINQTSKLFKICKNKTFSFFEIIENNFQFHSNIKFILNTICDFLFGIYIWLLIPFVVICLLMQDNNLIFLVEFIIVFMIYYKYIKITSINYKRLENIFFYTWMMIISSIVVLCVIYIAQFLNKKPFSIWYALTSIRTKKNLELVGLFIFSGEYSYNFIAYISTFIISVALHCEIKRQITLNTTKANNNSESQSKEKEEKNFTQNLSYIKKVYMLLYYILHYYWILIFIVVAILSIHWMLSISMAIQLILFSYYIMKSFMGYYNCMNKSNLQKKNLSDMLELYKEEKKKHFKITSDNQQYYYNLIWKFTFTFILLTYLCCITLKFVDNKKVIKIISAVLYLLGFYSNSINESKLNFIYYSWGYFVILGLFSFRGYFMSKFKELIIREEKVKKKERKEKRRKERKKNLLIKSFTINVDRPIKNIDDEEEEIEDDDDDDESNSPLSSEDGEHLNNTFFNEMNFGTQKKKNDDEDMLIPSIRQRKKSTYTRTSSKFGLASIYLDSDESFPNLFDTTTLGGSLNVSTNDVLNKSTIISQRGQSIELESRLTFQIGNQDNQSSFSSRDDSSINYRSQRKKKYISYSLKLQIGIKRFIEVIMIVLILTSAVIKANIISFFFLVCVILTYSRKVMSTKIMFNISLAVLSVFIVQYILFVSNISYDTNPFTDNEVISYIEELFYVPWYKHFLGTRWGTFFSCGVVRYQLNALWIDVIILIILYFYLEFFSFTIYETENVEKQKKSFEKYNFQFSSSKSLTMEQYHSFARSMKISYNINLIPIQGANGFEGREMCNFSPQSIKYDKKLKLYKYIRSYFYLSFHYIALVLIMLIASQERGLLSLGYMTFSMFYIYKSHNFLEGKDWTFERGIRFFLKPYLFLDLLAQFIFQIPFDAFRTSLSNFTIYLDIFGFVNLVDYSSRIEFINKSGLLTILLKVVTYFFVLIQEIVYNSYDFKKFILKYHFDYMEKAYIKGKLHSFLFNNYRIKLMNDRLNEQNEINATLKKIEGMIVKWNDKLTNRDRKRSSSISLKYNSQKSQGSKKTEKISISKILKKQWFISLAYAIYEESRSISHNKIRDKKEIMEILKGKIIMNCELDEKIAEFEKNNQEEIEKYKINRRKSQEIQENPLIEDIKEKSMSVFPEIIENKEEEIKKEEIKENDNQLNQENKNKEEEIKIAQKEDEPLIEEKLEESKKEDGKEIMENLKINDVIENKIETEQNEITNKNVEKVNDSKEELIKEEIPSPKNNKSSFLELSDTENFFTSSEYYELKGRLRSKFFKEYCSKTKIFLFMLHSISKFLIENFEYVCYFFMIFNHFMNGNLISVVWVIMVFILGITQYPRPERLYWKICLIYCSFIIFVKFFFQLNLWEHLSIFQSFVESTNPYIKKIGIKKCNEENGNFFGYVIYDFILLSIFITNQFMLVRNGLWNMTELDYETIEEANDRIQKFNSEKYKDNSNINKKKKKDEQLTNEEIVNLLGKAKNTEFESIKKRLRAFYQKNFTFVRNEKPGKDFYLYYTIIQMIILIYVIFFYTKMDQDKLIYNVDSFQLKQFSGDMVIVAFIHLFLIVFDRFIYLKNSRKTKKIAFKVYNIKTGEDVTSDFKNETYESAETKIKEQSDTYSIVEYQYEGTQFGLICKFLVQIITVVGIHFMLFWYFPIQGNENLQNVDKSNNNEFLSNPFLILFYLLYIIYFIFSGMQIKYGLADMRKKSSLMKGSNMYYSIIFQSFKAIPFLFEIKCFLDWTFTATAFDVFKWLKYEEINALLYINKCYAKSYVGRRVGTKSKVIVKIFMGGFSVFAVLIVVFLPLILFSTLNPSNMPNDIIGVNFRVDLSILDKGDNVYERDQIMNFTLFKSTNSKYFDVSYENYENLYSNDSITKVYNFKQIQNISIIGYSDTNWDISIGGYDYIIEQIKLNSEINLILRFSFTRAHDTSPTNYIGYQNYSLTNQALKSFFFNERDEPKQLSELTTGSLTFSYMPHLKVPSDSNPTGILLINETTTEWNLKLMVSNSTLKEKYWTLCKSDTKSGIDFITFSDLYSSATAGYDILTFYVTFILVVGKYIRSMLLGEAERVMYTEMINPNKLLNVCEGIRISRIKKDFLQEDKLYYLLIDLMRSPEIIKTITKSSLTYVQKGNLIQEEYRHKENDVESIVLQEKFNDHHRKAFEN